MPRKNDSWGIEVGANAIKAVRLARSGSKAELVDYEILPFKQILTTPDLNIDEAIQVNLDAFLAKHDVAKSTVVASVPGHMAFARFAKLPPVEPKEIPNIVRFEAMQQIPFPIDQVEWDYQVFQQPDSPDVSVGIFAITKERVSTFLNNYRRVNLRVDALTLSPLAVYNAYSYEHAEDEDTPGTIYLDIGTTCTDVIIVEDGGIWLRTLPIGGNNFTEALVRAFKLSFPKAEKLKREAGTSKYARQIFQAMRPVFADLVQELQRSLGYYQSLNRNAQLTRLVGVGSTFRLPGLQKFLKQQLQMDVIRPDGFKRIAVDGKREAEFADHALNMATAYGLALQGLGLDRVSANILPKQILKQRMWKAKEPWIAAAAACVVAATGLYGTRYYTSTAAHDARVEATQREVRPILTEADNYVRQAGEITAVTDPRQQIENLRRVPDYRDLWAKLIADIALAAQSVGPQPETLTADYQAIAAIPRAQRRRIHVEAVDIEYLVGGTDGAQQGLMMPAPSAQPGQEPWSVAKTIDDFWGETAGKPPRFKITMRGTTSFNDVARLLSRDFVGWLQQNAERPDRPYRFVVDPRSAVVEIRPAAVTPDSRSGRSPRAGAGFLNPGMIDPMMDPGIAPEPEPRTGGRFGVRPSASAPAFNPSSRSNDTVDSLLPQRPLSGENRSGDSQFVVTWTVELLRPEAARKAENPGSQNAAPEPVAPDVPDQAQSPSSVPSRSPAAHSESSGESAVGPEEVQL